MNSPIRDVNKIIPDAYHGTSYENGMKIIRDQKFIPSNDEDQYLGDGVYFFEGSDQDAAQWAKKKVGGGGKISIICATVNLGKCLDLNNRAHRELIKQAVDSLKKKRRIPYITDAVAINFIATQFNIKVDTVRATYQPNRFRQKIFSDSRFYDSNRLVICVKKLDNILDISLHREGLL